MDAPTGKGLYTRGARVYPDGDVAGYAAALGCQFVVFHEANHDDHILRAQDMGLGTYLYAMPDAWLPSTWQETAYRQFERVMIMNMDGMVADVEQYDPPSGERWKGKQREVQELVTTLGGAALETSVGFTSFPSWPWYDDMARAGLWGSPQLYGVAQGPVPSNNELVRRGDTWKEVFPQIVPSLAGWGFCNKGCVRTLADEWNYLNTFRAERGGILWTTNTPPLPGTDRFQLLREWNVDYPFGGIGAGGSAWDVALSRFIQPLRIGRS